MPQISNTSPHPHLPRQMQNTSACRAHARGQAKAPSTQTGQYKAACGCVCTSLHVCALAYMCVHQPTCVCTSLHVCAPAYIHDETGSLENCRPLPCEPLTHLPAWHGGLLTARSSEESQRR